MTQHIDDQTIRVELWPTQDARNQYLAHTGRELGLRTRIDVDAADLPRAVLEEIATWPDDIEQRRRPKAPATTWEGEIEENRSEIRVPFVPRDRTEWGLLAAWTQSRRREIRAEAEKKAEENRRAAARREAEKAERQRKMEEAEDRRQELADACVRRIAGAPIDERLRIARAFGSDERAALALAGLIFAPSQAREEWRPWADHINTLVRQEKEEDLRRIQADREEWIAAHGSDRLRRMAEKEIEHRQTYLDERLAAERPGWHWNVWDADTWPPANVPDAALDLLDEAREGHDGTVLLKVWSVEADHGAGYVATAYYLGQTIVWGVDDDGRPEIGLED